MAVAATEVQPRTEGQISSQVSHKRESVFEQPLRFAAREILLLHIDKRKT
jgi:hypothetical protein